MSADTNDLPAALAAYKAAREATARAQEATVAGKAAAGDPWGKATVAENEARYAALRAQWRADRIGIARQAVADARAAMANVHSTEPLHAALAAEFLQHDLSHDAPSTELRGVDDAPEAG